MSIPKAIAESFLSGPMVAQLRLRGVPVAGSEKPVVWRVSDSGQGRAVVPWKLDGYARFDEAVVVSDGEVLVRYREEQELGLPPGAVYEAEFVFVVAEG